VETLDAYLPIDRRQALARGAALPDRVEGAALFADISGFTPLTEALVQELGPQRGVEELTHHLNRVFDALIAELHRFGGSVIGFGGDAITCWLEGDTGLRATACALAMQQAMGPFAAVTIPSGGTFTLAMKVAVATGAARRFLVGDPGIHLIDVLAGATLDRLAKAEHHAGRGEVVLDAQTVHALGDQVQIGAWRHDDGTEERFGVVEGLAAQVGDTPWRSLAPGAQVERQVRSWLLPPVYELLRAGRGEFLAELRPVVVLFCRFTGIDYDGDDQAGEKLDAYIRWIQSVLARYEGYLLFLSMGDKGSYLGAAFGAPIAHEDDAERAVSAALELRVLPGELDFVKDVQIGISQGRMLAGAYGGTARRTYGVMGDDVNLAARLMEAAAPGQILVSRRVQVAAGESFIWESLPDRKVKGKAEPVAVFSPVRAQRRRAVRLHEARYALPMVGREAELALIEQKLDLALKGRGQIVGITGEAGIGKSRLVAEVIALANERQLDGYASECESYGTNTSYLVWWPIWRALYDVDPAWDVADQVRALEEGLERIDPALVARAPLLGAVLNLPIPDNELTQAFDAKLRKESLEALLVDCLRALAQAGPLLLVLEDCHWLDPLSHDLTEVIGRAVADLPVMLLMVYRPPELARLQAPRVSVLPHFSEVRLVDFTSAEAERLIALKLEQFFGPDTRVPPALVDRITARAQGNPFYIEELLNYLRDQGISPQDMVALEQLDLPTSLHSLILSRLDQRTESQKVTLRVASVIGRLFRAALLWGMYPEIGTPERVKADLDALCFHDLTRVDAPEPELTYLFKHIVTQEVAYESLPYATRAMLHEQLAGFIEQTFGEPLEQYVDLLAYHYERSENLPKKREYLLKAGEAAQADYANQAAIDYYQRLLPLLPAGEQAYVLCRSGEVLTLVGHYDEALERYDKALNLVESGAALTGKGCQLADLCRKIADVYERRSEYDRALEWLDKGLSHIGDEGPMIEHANIYLLWAGVSFRQRRLDETIAWCRKGLMVASEIRSAEGQLVTARADILLGNVYHRRGELHRAVEFYRDSIAVYEQIGNVVGQSKAYNNLGSAYRTLGDWDQASDALEKSLVISREIGEIQEQGIVTNNLGNLYLCRGDWAEAAQLLDQSQTIWKQVGAPVWEALTSSNLAQVHVYQGDLTEAHACLSRSQAIFDGIGFTAFLPELERRWGEYFLRTEALDEALTHVRRSIELAKEQQDRLEEGMSSRVVGQVYMALGEREPARDVLYHSLKILTELGNEYEAARTVVSLARLGAGNGAALDRAQLEHAIEIFEKLGAKADLSEALAIRG
jgi:adenylate cyclase